MTEWYIGFAIGGPCDGRRLVARVPFFWAPLITNGKRLSAAATNFEYRFRNGAWYPVAESDQIDKRLRMSQRLGLNPADVAIWPLDLLDRLITLEQQKGRETLLRELHRLLTPSDQALRSGTSA